jgi:hypothetical protein
VIPYIYFVDPTAKWKRDVGQEPIEVESIPRSTQRFKKIRRSCVQLFNELNLADEPGYSVSSRA